MRCVLGKTCLCQYDNMHYITKGSGNVDMDISVHRAKVPVFVSLCCDLLPMCSWRKGDKVDYKCRP